MSVRALASVLSLPFTAALCLGLSPQIASGPWSMPRVSETPRFMLPAQDAPGRALTALGFTPAAVHSEQPSAPAQPVKGRFLIASRALLDPNFAETVILVLNTDAGGTIGVVINHPTKMRLAEVLPDEKALHDRPDRVFLGGPVGTNVMLLLVHAHSAPAKAEKILDDVYATGNMSTLRDAFARKGRTDRRLRAYAGYAGWGPGQLEREIARGDWLLGSGDAATIFELRPADIWPKLIERFSGAWTKNRAIPGSWLLMSGI